MTTKYISLGPSTQLDAEMQDITMVCHISRLSLLKKMMMTECVNPISLKLPQNKKVYSSVKPSHKNCAAQLIVL